MKRPVLIAVVFAAGASSGCASMLGAPMMGPGMYAPPPRPSAIAAPPTSALGRWDQVMSLRPNWIVDVLDSDGYTHTGRFVRASVHTLTFVTTGGEHEMARAEVIKVDLIQAENESGATAKEVGLGAAAGTVSIAASTALLPFLFCGKLFLPPPQVLAVGAVAGGMTAVGRGREARRPRTIYLARINDA